MVGILIFYIQGVFHGYFFCAVVGAFSPHCNLLAVELIVFVSDFVFLSLRFYFSFFLAGRAVPEPGAGIRARDGVQCSSSVPQKQADTARAAREALSLSAREGSRAHSRPRHLSSRYKATELATRPSGTVHDVITSYMTHQSAVVASVVCTYVSCRASIISLIGLEHSGSERAV